MKGRIRFVDTDIEKTKPWESGFRPHSSDDGSVEAGSWRWAGVHGCEDSLKVNVLCGASVGRSGAPSPALSYLLLQHASSHKGQGSYFRYPLHSSQGCSPGLTFSECPNAPTAGTPWSSHFAMLCRLLHVITDAVGLPPPDCEGCGVLPKWLPFAFLFPVNFAGFAHFCQVSPQLLVFLRWVGVANLTARSLLLHYLLAFRFRKNEFPLSD